MGWRYVRRALLLAAIAGAGWVWAPRHLPWTAEPRPVLLAKNGPWQTLEGCELVPVRWNDGDSFQIRHQGREYIFRLYFVDTSETDLSSDERVAEQARYFGISTDASVALGRRAAAFTTERLSGRTFTVRTRWRDALGRSRLGRSYALVEVDGRDLGEQLVEQGLARLHGMRTTLPGGGDSSLMVSRLTALEQRAKAERRGGWAR